MKKLKIIIFYCLVFKKEFFNFTWTKFVSLQYSKKTLYVPISESNKSWIQVKLFYLNRL